MPQFFTTIQLYKKEKGFKSTLMILPPAWIEYSIETYIYQHTTKSQVTMGASIKYSRESKTYYYTNDFDLKSKIFKL